MNDDPIELYCLCADWCGTCRDFRALFEAQQAPGVRLAWVDIEDEAEALGDLDIETFPTLLLAAQGQVRFFGPVLPNSAALRQLLQRAAELPPAGAAVQALWQRLRELANAHKFGR